MSSKQLLSQDFSWNIGSTNNKVNTIFVNNIYGIPDFSINNLKFNYVETANDISLIQIYGNDSTNTHYSYLNLLKDNNNNLVFNIDQYDSPGFIYNFNNKNFLKYSQGTPLEIIIDSLNVDNIYGNNSSDIDFSNNITVPNISNIQLLDISDISTTNLYFNGTNISINNFLRINFNTNNNFNLIGVSNGVSSNFFTLNLSSEISINYINGIQLNNITISNDNINIPGTISGGTPNFQYPLYFRDSLTSPNFGSLYYIYNNLNGRLVFGDFSNSNSLSIINGYGYFSDFSNVTGDISTSHPHISQSQSLIQVNKLFITSNTLSKSNIISINDSVNVFNKINPLKYLKSDKIDNSENTFIEVGLIAQDILKIKELENSVNKDEIYSLNYNNIFIYLISYVKELIKLVEEKENKIKNIKEKLIKIGLLS